MVTICDNPGDGDCSLNGKNYRIVFEGEEECCAEWFLQDHVNSADDPGTSMVMMACHFPPPGAHAVFDDLAGRGFGHTPADAG
mmetsp:Transcript_6129/g.13422  ORF Transcript_6129/g.13422 Transcript_6129/m.13422 type:complete len:83 (+) Transcript_6129:233-481(+)